MTAAETVLAHRFFAGLPAEVVAVLARHAEPVSLPAGVLIGREGDPADHFYALTAGLVALQVTAPDRPAEVLETLGAGEVLGWSWLAPPYRWHFDAVAVAAVTALRLDARGLLTEMDRDPVLAATLLRRFVPVLVDRLQATRLRLLDLYARVPG